MVIKKGEKSLHLVHIIEFFVYFCVRFAWYAPCLNMGGCRNTETEN